jgi:hypothetical protein
MREIDQKYPLMYPQTRMRECLKEALVKGGATILIWALDSIL